MSRYSAVTLDLSRFPPPLAIRGINYEDILQARKDALQAAFDKYGIPYDVAMLETDPAIILQQSDAYRELLATAAINDAFKSGLIAFATGADLDHLGITAALNLPRGHRDLMLRRVIVPATGTTPAVKESDAEYRRRLMLAPEAYATAGTEGGYLFHALSASPGVINADAWSPAPGEVMVALQGREGLAEASGDVIAAVRSHLFRRDVKPLTNVVSVRSVTTHPYEIAVKVYVQPGPDPAAVRTLVADTLAAMTVARRTPGRDVPLSAITAAASVGPVDRVVVQAPLADQVRDRGELAVCTAISVEIETHVG